MHNQGQWQTQHNHSKCSNVAEQMQKGGTGRVFNGKLLVDADDEECCSYSYALVVIAHVWKRHSLK